METVFGADPKVARKFVGIGSQAEYGRYDRRIAETDLPQPTMLYGAAKLAACHLAAQRCREAGADFAWLRLFSVYGPRDNANWLIPSTAAALVRRKVPLCTAGTQKWDYLHIDDVADGVLAAATTDRATGVFNLRGSPTMFYYVMLGLVALALGLCRWLLSGRLGHYWLAIREDPEAAQAIGIDVFRYKMFAVLLSSGMTALGGVFATIIFSVSVVSIPMILHRRTDAITAGLTSIRLVLGQPQVLLPWAAIITLLVVLAMLPWFAGLFVVGPILGHASWHAYRAAVEPPREGASP